MEWMCANAETHLNRTPPISVTATAPENNPLNFIYPGFNHDQYHPLHQPGDLGMIMDVKHPMFLEQAASSVMETKECITEECENLQELKRKRLSAEQWNTLEKNFQEEVKLNPAKKTSLAKELNFEPRQVAVWFQIRRARWKNTQLEKMYDKLKQDFNAVNREKQYLHEEVLKLKAMLKARGLKTQQVSKPFTEFSSLGTVEKTMVAVQPPTPAAIFQQNGGACNYYYDHYGFHSPAALASSYWSAHLPPDPSKI